MIWLIIGVIVIILSFFGCIAVIAYVAPSSNLYIIISLLGMLVGMVLMLIGVSIGAQERLNTLYNDIEQGYEIYIDGNPVLPESIDITMYEATIDDVNQKIFLTPSN